MKFSINIAVLVLLIAMPKPLHANERAAVPLAGVLSIEFVDVPAAGATLLGAGSDAWIDLRLVSQEAGSTRRSVRIRRQFAVRVLRSGEVSWGTAAVTATLNSPDGRSFLRIDGQSLGTRPLLVSARAAVGALIIHTLEIEVPDSVVAGPLAASISWEATAQ